jgi:hypothetical protein
MLKKPPLNLRGGFLDVMIAWRRAIFAEGNPSTIFAAAMFHDRVRDGVGVVPPRHRHQEFCKGQLEDRDRDPEGCIANEL